MPAPRWRSRRVRTIAAVFLLVTSAGRAGATTSDQIWPGLKLFLPIKDRLRVLLLGQLRVAPESGYVAGQVGADLELQVAPLRAKLFPTIQVSKRERATLAVGYRYLGTLAEDGFGSFRENRFLAEATFRLLLPADILASDRNRIEGRLRNGDWS